MNVELLSNPCTVPIAAKSSAYSVLDNEAPLHNLYSDGIFAPLPSQATIVPTGSSLPPVAVEVIVNPD